MHRTCLTVFNTLTRAFSRVRAFCSERVRTCPKARSAASDRRVQRTERKRDFREKSTRNVARTFCSCASLFFQIRPNRCWCWCNITRGKNDRRKYVQNEMPAFARFPPPHLGRYITTRRLGRLRSRARSSVLHFSTKSTLNVPTEAPIYDR